MFRPFALFCALGLVGCSSVTEPTQVSAPASAQSEKELAVSLKPPQSTFAADRGGPEPIPFESKRALGYLRDVCNLGPRVSGSEGMKKQQELLTKHFTALGGKVSLQEFKATQLSQKAQVEMANMIVAWHPEAKRRVIFCAHYDTRPIADQEEDPRRWTLPFLSANDGGSGVAWLMEFAHHMKNLKTNVGIDFVLFDGEEYIFRKNDLFFFGSKHFANAYKQNRAGLTYQAAVLLDMIAGKKPTFKVEMNSWFLAHTLVEEIWKTANEVKATAFAFTNGPTVEDDHLALNRANIPAVDIIDFTYPHWHKLSDTPENCSAEGLEQVALVLSTWVQRVK